MEKMFNKIKSKFFKEVKRAVIQNPYGELHVGSSGITFVILVGSNFNQTIPNAATTCRMGWAHGFEEIGVPYIFLGVHELERGIGELNNPVIWTTGYEIDELSKDQRKFLREHKVAIYVNPWFNDEKKYYTEKNFTDISWNAALRKKVLQIEPSFVFTIAPTSSFEFFRGWIDNGVKLVSLPMACDTKVYSQNSKYFEDYKNVKMAFVGGYWGYKAISFDKYLKPYQEQLSVFGYSSWPYANYKGKLPIENENSLYKQAMLCPVINEPHVSLMGVDINERVFKVLGSGGLAITDVTPGYREHFKDDELIVPGSIKEYHEIVNTVLNDNSSFGSNYRIKGQNAVLDRHTYKQRAIEFLKCMEIDPFRENKNNIPA